MGSENSKRALEDSQGEEEGAPPAKKWKRTENPLELLTKGKSDMTRVTWRVEDFKSKIGKVKDCPQCEGRSYMKVLASQAFVIGEPIGLPSRWQLDLNASFEVEPKVWLTLRCLKGPEGVGKIVAKVAASTSGYFIGSSTQRTLREHTVGGGQVFTIIRRTEPVLPSKANLKLKAFVEIFKMTEGGQALQNSGQYEGAFELVKKLYLEPEATGADLILRFTKDGSRERRVHRNILTARNPVFAAMFQANMTESKTGVVVIDDISCDVMEVVLDFIYTGRLPEKVPTLEGDLMTTYGKELVNAAEKYGLDKLTKFCDANLIQICTGENALELLSVAVFHQLNTATMDICDLIKSKAARSNLNRTEGLQF